MDGTTHNAMAKTTGDPSNSKTRTPETIVCYRNSPKLRAWLVKDGCQAREGNVCTPGSGDARETFDNRALCHRDFWLHGTGVHDDAIVLTQDKACPQEPRELDMSIGQEVKHISEQSGADQKQAPHLAVHTVRCSPHLAVCGRLTFCSSGTWTFLAFFMIG